MNICLCGAQAGYGHDPRCPYPMYRDDPQWSLAHEHSWVWNGAHWLCGHCQKEAVSEDLQIEPCLICGAECDADATYCDACIDNMYRGVPQV